MKHYLLFMYILPLLLFALSDEHSSKNSSHSSDVVHAVYTDAVLPAAGQKGDMHTGAVHTGAVHTGAVHTGAVHTEVISKCKNRSSKAKKICTKRNCLKHHKEDSFPSEGIPASVCSIPLVAVLSQPEDFHFSAPAALAGRLVFHTVSLLTPDLEQEPHPPRYS